MQILSRNTHYLDSDLKVSIVKFSESHYELAVMYYFLGKWEIDYSIFNDVITVDSSMQVYGTIEHVIKPAYDLDFPMHEVFSFLK